MRALLPDKHFPGSFVGAAGRERALLRSRAYAGASALLLFRPGQGNLHWRCVSWPTFTLAESCSFKSTLMLRAQGQYRYRQAYCRTLLEQRRHEMSRFTEN